MFGRVLGESTKYNRSNIERTIIVSLDHEKSRFKLICMIENRIPCARINPRSNQTGCRAFVARSVSARCLNNCEGGARV